MTDQGVTIVVTRTIKAGREAEYEQWLRGFAETAGRFPGHLGITVFRPRPGSRDYTFVGRFDSEANLAVWEKSPERADWLERAAELAERVKVERTTGIEAWFAHPETPLLAPPRWKMAIVTWFVAFPLIQIIAPAVATLGIPAMARSALMVVGMVLMMTYLVMPAATRALRGWLFR